MPEFEMPFEGNADCDAFDLLDSFTQGYVHAIFFTDTCDSADECHGMAFAHLAPASLQSIKDDCKDFQEGCKDLLTQACTDDNRYDAEQAGSDFWYTRNGHGAGFWDRGLGRVGDELTKQAKSYGSCDVHKGTDGAMHVV